MMNRPGLHITSIAVRQPALRRWSWLAYVSPVWFDPLARKLAPWFGAAALLFLTTDLYVGFVVVPTDARQGEVHRTIFLHVPAVRMSMFIYLVMASYCVLGLVLRIRLSSMMASVLVPTGALFIATVLWAGALWGKSVWSTRQVRGTRLTLELLLPLLYPGFIALENTIEEPLRAGRACAILIAVGVVNFLVIYFSVQWWNTLHRDTPVSLTAAPSMVMTVLLGTLLTTLACQIYNIYVMLVRVHYIMRERSDDDLNSTVPA